MSKNQYRNLCCFIFALVAASWSVVCVSATNSSIRAPIGYYQAVEQVTDTKSFSCPDIPVPYTGKLNFVSKYEGDDASKDTLNKGAELRYTRATKSIRSYEEGLIKLASTVVKNAREDAPMQCMVQWYKRWASAGALQDPDANSIGKAARKWALATSASAWMRVKLAQPASYRKLSPKTITTIESWFGVLAHQVVLDYSQRSIEKINNHDYWAAWAVMATAVVLNDRKLFAWSADVYRVAMTQIDAEGYLPNELARQTRALTYHNFALQPLAMLHVFLVANQHEVAEYRKDRFILLAKRVLLGITTPALFAKKTGYQQVVDNLPSSNSLAWLEPFNAVFPGKENTLWMEKFSPLVFSRMGGNMTEIFSGNSLKTKKGISSPLPQRISQ